MKFRKLLLVGATAFVTLNASAQTENRECDRMRLIAGEAIKVEDYKKAAAYYLKGEVICGGYDKANWDRMTGALNNVIVELQAPADEAAKKAYIDTLLAAYDRMEAAGLYDPSTDFARAAYYLQATTVDVKKADMYFVRGIQTQGVKMPEAYLPYAYYTTFMLYNGAQGEEKAELKKRLISDYFDYTELITKAGFTPATQESLTSYFNGVVQSCADILPEIEGYIAALSPEKDPAIFAIKRMLTLMDTKGCTESKEYDALIEAWLKLDPNSMEALLIKVGKMKGPDAIPILREIMSKTEDAELKQECQYKIAYSQFNAGSYQAAFASGKACTGKYRSDGLFIAAKCVAATANSCGNSTFERKCNYIYAAQLADQAGQSGAAATYRSKAPSSAECFNENNPSSVSLSCWGVSVSPCN